MYAPLERVKRLWNCDSGIASDKFALSLSAGKIDLR